MRAELKELRKDCLRVSHAGQDGNLQSGFSSIEILWTLYRRIMNWSVDRATVPGRDIFVLSKGQSTLALHVLLMHLGLFSKEEVMGFCQYDSRFSMQADRTKFPEGGIEVSAGSLGHGFPIAVGMAMARKIQQSAAHVYVLAGDGEMNEGTMWEAAALAAAHHLDNLCLIIDDNQSLGAMLDFGSLQTKLEAFEFVTHECDGHDTEALTDTIRLAVDEARQKKKPACIIAKTIRGYGAKTLMENPAWFHCASSAEELNTLLREVDEFA